MSFENENKNKDFAYDSDELSLNFFFNTLKRGIKTIFFASTIFTIICFLYFNSQKPKYKGRFEIVTKEKTKDDISSRISDISSLVPQVSSLVSQTEDKKTQELILKSPSVLNPVFEFVKEQYELRGQDSENLTYSVWLRNNLEIGFIKKTDILEVSFIDTDQKLILDTLNLIASKYADYSRKNRKKSLERVLSYLEKQQQSLKERSSKSMLALNKFSIENGLGDIDGFVSLESIPSLQSSNDMRTQLLKTNQDFLIQDKDKDKAGQRFSSQLRQLEKYELQMIDLSSKLKPSSIFLKDLKSKIEAFKTSLQRPNEILLKYRELKKTALREDKLLGNIENQIETYSLELAKQDEPWKLISNPTLKNHRLRLRTRIIFPFFLGLFLSTLYIFIREKKSGKIYELEILKEELKCKYLESFYFSNISLSNKLLENLFYKETTNKRSNNKKEKISFVFINELSIKEFREFISKDLNLNYKLLNINDVEKNESSDQLVFVLMPGNINYKEVNLINNYIKIFKERVFGWILLDKVMET